MDQSGWIKKRTWLLALLIIPLIAEGIFFFHFSQNLAVTYYDSYDYLNNTRALIDSKVPYLFFRPPGLPLIQLPPTLLAKIWFHQAWSLFFSSFWQVIWSLGWLLALWFLLLRLYPENLALIGVWLCALNRVFIHYAPFVMPDIPTALCWTLVAYVYLRVKNKTLEDRALYSIPILIALSVAIRYNSSILLLILLFCEGRILRSQALSRRFWVRWGILMGVMVGLTFLLLQIPALMGVSQASRTLSSPSWLFQLNKASFPLERILDYFDYLRLAFPTPLWIFLLFGLIIAAFRRTLSDCFFGITLLVFFFTMSFFLAEARYLFLIFPACFYLILCAFSTLLRAISKTQSLLIQRALIMGLYGALLCPALIQGVSELAHFKDPIYTLPFSKRFSHILDAATPPPGRIFWFGESYPLYPTEYVFSPSDRYFYLYHFGANVITSHTRRTVTQFFQYSSVDPQKVLQATLYPIYLQRLYEQVHAFDTCVFSLPWNLTTWEIPEKALSLYMVKLKVTGFVSIPSNGPFENPAIRYFVDRATGNKILVEKNQIKLLDFSSMGWAEIYGMAEKDRTPQLLVGLRNLAEEPVLELHPEEQTQAIDGLQKAQTIFLVQWFFLRFVPGSPVVLGTFGSPALETIEETTEPKEIATHLLRWVQ
jgi:hypothetical protein